MTQERENELYAINSFEQICKLLPLVDIYPLAISDVVDNCTSLIQELDKYLITDFWSTYDDCISEMFNCGGTRGNGLTNAIIDTLFYSLETTIKELFREDVELSYIVNGEDSSFYINGEDIFNCDLREYMR